jgi:hypothetical protein
MNMGVIIIGSSRYSCFKEKVSRYNYFGLLLAIIALYLSHFQILT